jgi:hypothetical protein
MFSQNSQQLPNISADRLVIGQVLQHEIAEREFHGFARDAAQVYTIRLSPFDVSGTFQDFPRSIKHLNGNVQSYYARETNCEAVSHPAGTTPQFEHCLAHGRETGTIQRRPYEAFVVFVA